jgi:hypothetical protein
MFAAILAFAGTFFTGLFGFKGDQARTVQSSLETLKGLNDAEAQSVVAQSQAIGAILTQGSFLERNWRAIAMVGIMILIVAYFFGYAPPNIYKPLPPMLDRLFSLFEIGLVGYISRYGIRDIIREFKISSIIQELIKKKVM